MLTENTRVRAKIQSAFEQLAMPHVAKVRCSALFGNTSTYLLYPIFLWKQSIVEVYIFKDLMWFRDRDKEI